MSLLKLKDKTYTVVFDFDTLVEWELHTGLNFIADHQRAIGSAIKSPLLLWCALKANHREEFPSVEFLDEHVRNLPVFLSITNALNSALNEAFGLGVNIPEEVEEKKIVPSKSKTISSKPLESV
jgi:hypothetical protein